MSKTIVSLEDIIEHYIMGSRLTGFITENNKSKVKMYHINSNNINHINLDKNNNLIIDNKTIFCLEYIVMSNGEPIKVDKVIRSDDTRRKLCIYTEVTDDKSIEDNTIDVLLITRVLCSLANKKLNITMQRYKNKSDYKLGNVGLNIVIGKKFKNMPEPEYPESTNALYIPETYDGSIKELVKTLKNLLNIKKNISYLRIYKIYSDYKKGRLENKNFELWGMAYNKFYKLDPDLLPMFQLETMANDYNTRVIVSYLVSVYKKNYYKTKSTTIPLEITNFHPDIVAIGSDKYKVDIFYKRIKMNYINSMFKQNNKNKPTYSYIMDINRLLNQEDMKKYTDLLIYVINIVKENNGIKIVVNLNGKYKEGVIGYFNSTSIAKILERDFMLSPLTIEFNPII